MSDAGAARTAGGNDVAPASSGPDTDMNAGVAHDERALPWWRRPRRLRRQVAGTLVLVALASVSLVAGLNFVAARQLLDEGTKDQLVSVGEARARSIDLGIGRVLGSTSALAADLAVVESLQELSDAYTSLSGGVLDEDETAALDARYLSLVVDPLNELPLEVPVTLDDVRPRTDAGRYAQYHYALTGELDSRRDVDDAGDGSEYSGVHARRHPQLRELADILGLGDLLLVNADGDVVYSVEKRIDFGTNLLEGPYRDSNLADTLRRRLTRVPVGEAVLADLEIYVPGGAKPVAFVVAAVRRDTEVIGALVAQIPVAALNAITTANERWEEVGLSTGESYVVGPDQVLVSESRRWIEDPERYLGKVDDPSRRAFIEALGSPVGLQPVETRAVETALDGGTFEGTGKNYLGERTFTYATPISAQGVEWVVVADIPLGKAREPLYDYAATVGLVLLIILPIAAVVGLWLANRLTRPIAPVVAAALAVAEGERNPDIPDLGRDEFGDLARQLRRMTAELASQEQALADQYEQRRQLLLTVLPSRVVEADGVVAGRGDSVETATVVAVSFHVAVEGLLGDENELASLLSEALASAEQLAGDHGIERVRAAADQYLFLAGIGAPSEEADSALAFAVQLDAMLNELAAREEVPVEIHIGLASGPIATGMLERGNLTFAAWGEPVRRALALGALSRTDELLVDASTATAATPDRWSLVPATDLVDLDGQPMALFALAPTDDEPGDGGETPRA